MGQSDADAGAGHASPKPRAGLAASPMDCAWLLEKSRRADADRADTERTTGGSSMWLKLVGPRRSPPTAIRGRQAQLENMARLKALLEADAESKRRRESELEAAKRRQEAEAGVRRQAKLQAAAKVEREALAQQERARLQASAERYAARAADSAAEQARREARVRSLQAAKSQRRAWELGWWEEKREQEALAREGEVAAAAAVELLAKPEAELLDREQMVAAAATARETIEMEAEAEAGGKASASETATTARVSRKAEGAMAAVAGGEVARPEAAAREHMVEFRRKRQQRLKRLELLQRQEEQRQASEAAEREGRKHTGPRRHHLGQRRFSGDASPEVVAPAPAAEVVAPAPALAAKVVPKAKVATISEAGEDPGRAKQIAEREALREARRAASRTASSLASPLPSPLPSPAVSVPASPVPRRSRLSLGAQSSPRVRRPELW